MGSFPDSLRSGRGETISDPPMGWNICDKTPDDTDLVNFWAVAAVRMAMKPMPTSMTMMVIARPSLVCGQTSP